MVLFRNPLSQASLAIGRSFIAFLVSLSVAIFRGVRGQPWVRPTHKKEEQDRAASRRAKASRAPSLVHDEWLFWVERQETAVLGDATNPCYKPLIADHFASRRSVAER